MIDYADITGGRHYQVTNDVMRTTATQQDATTAHLATTTMVKSSDVILILVAILFPPAAAAIITGCSCDLLINILLTMLGYIPGHIHAFYLIYKKMQAEERYGRGGFIYIGNGTYQPLHNDALYPNQPAPNYGATNP